MHFYILCEKTDHDNDSCLFQHWSKEFQYRGHKTEPILQIIPMDSFGHQILVIEDDESIVEQLKTADLKVGVTVVTTHAKYWPNKFLSQDDGNFL